MIRPKMSLIKFELALNAFLVIIILLLVVVGVVKKSRFNPLPANIKNQVHYKVIYPAKVSTIDARSYRYDATRKFLSFTVKTDTYRVVFSEQPAIAALGSDTEAYYPALGVHPYAQFRVKLGQVALAKFWKSGSLKPYGQSAMMAAQHTLLITGSDKALTNQQWKDLFSSLKITK